METPLLAAHRCTALAVLWFTVAGLLWAAPDDGAGLGRIYAVEVQLQAARKFTPRGRALRSFAAPAGVAERPAPA